MSGIIDRKIPDPSESTGSEQHLLADLEQELLTRDEWLRLAAKGSELGLWLWSEIGNSLFWDAKTREIFGVPVDEVIGLETFYERLHPDDRDRTREIWRYTLENGVPYELIYRAQRPDGSVRWVNARGNGHYDKSGKPLYMVGVVFDITDEKKAEKERAELSGRLITAQELERTRIARELHDDFGQRLAMLQLQLVETAMLTGGSGEISQRLSEADAALAGIAEDIRSLSHRLHSSHLELLGLERGARSQCENFARQHKIDVKFEAIDLPSSITFETSLSLFRIMQEAMSNSVKHSSASNLKVQLCGEHDAVSLLIADDGIGIDLTSNYTVRGIGISTMKERSRMLGGTFKLISSPSVSGTQVEVRVPINPHL